MLRPRDTASQIGTHIAVYRTGCTTLKNKERKKGLPLPGNSFMPVLLLIIIPGGTGGDFDDAM